MTSALNWSQIRNSIHIIALAFILLHHRCCDCNTFDCPGDCGSETDTFTCVAGEACVVECLKEQACKMRNFVGGSATSFTVECNALQACADATFECAADVACTINCAGDASYACEGNMGIDAHLTWIFQCNGEDCDSFVTKTAMPSPVPTPQPTTQPLPLPTHAPTTNTPTEIPSKTPTKIPTYQPTIEPTLNPSNPPTNDPTNVPTYEPSLSPSPSDSPTYTPTTPTYDPTLNSFGPTTGPLTDAPSHDPSLLTDDPTSGPTRGPSPGGPAASAKGDSSFMDEFGITIVASVAGAVFFSCAGVAIYYLFKRSRLKSRIGQDNSMIQPQLAEVENEHSHENEDARRTEQQKIEAVAVSVSESPNLQHEARNAIEIQNEAGGEEGSSSSDSVLGNGLTVEGGTVGVTNQTPQPQLQQEIGGADGEADRGGTDTDSEELYGQHDGGTGGQLVEDTDTDTDTDSDSDSDTTSEELFDPGTGTGTGGGGDRGNPEAGDDKTSRGWQTRGRCDDINTKGLTTSPGDDNDDDDDDETSSSSSSD